MKNSLPLDSLLREYHKGNLNKKKLEGIIFEYILKNNGLFKMNRWPKDECIDFLCWFYPRISRAIDKYRKAGASFDAYITALIRWASREYIRAEKKHRITERTYWDACALERTVREAEPVYGDRDDNAPFKPTGKPRQVLLLLLKSYYFISEDFIDKAAPAIGMKRERLKYLVERLRSMRVQRDENLKNMQDHIHTLYYRCIAFERRMNASIEGSAVYEKLKGQLERTRRRLINTRTRFKQMRTQASNLQVAQVLGLPKGTIDSNLFAARTTCEYENTGESFPGGDYFDEDPAGRTAVT